jgi:hypothetical protein
MSEMVGTLLVELKQIPFSVIILADVLRPYTVMVVDVNPVTTGLTSTVGKAKDPVLFLQATIDAIAANNVIIKKEPCSDFFICLIFCFSFVCPSTPALCTADVKLYAIAKIIVYYSFKINMLLKPPQQTNNF